MPIFQLSYNVVQKVILLQNEGKEVPNGYTDIGTFTHNHDDDPLGKKITHNHVFWHHVRDLLYKIGVFSMQSIKIVKEVGLIEDTIIPPPVYSVLPSITPSEGIAGETVFTAHDGEASNTDQFLRRWLLNGVQIGTGPTVVAPLGGSLKFEGRALGLGGVTLQDSNTIEVEAPSAPILDISNFETALIAGQSYNFPINFQGGEGPYTIEFLDMDDESVAPPPDLIFNGQAVLGTTRFVEETTNPEDEFAGAKVFADYQTVKYRIENNVAATLADIWIEDESWDVYTEPEIVPGPGLNLVETSVSPTFHEDICALFPDGATFLFMIGNTQNSGETWIEYWDSPDYNDSVSIRVKNASTGSAIYLPSGTTSGQPGLGMTSGRLAITVLKDKMAWCINGGQVREYTSGTAYDDANTFSFYLAGYILYKMAIYDPVSNEALAELSQL